LQGKRSRVILQNSSKWYVLYTLKCIYLWKHYASELTTDRSNFDQFLTWRCSLGGYGHNARSAKDLCTRTFSAQGLLFLPQFKSRSLLRSSH